MKKIVLSLASVLAATAFAPEASAIPSFARQTGMACTACHAQHFPVLNGFGRAFKAAGYTMMGAQGKVEGDHLSVPDTLNASMLMKLRYQKQNTAATVGAGTTAATTVGDGQWQMFDEFALFFGGRVAENVGFMFEGNVVAPGASLLAGFKLPFGFDMGGARLSIIPFSTDALGVQYGYEQSSGGVMRANRWSESRRETSAIQFNADRGADAGAASGFSFVAQNDMGFINLTRWSPSFLPGGNGAAVASTNFKNNYVRIAATPTLGGWASVIGLGRMSGSSFSNVALAEILTDQTFFDAQFQGEVAGKELGVYLQHAKAPAGTALRGNSYNSANIAAVAAGALGASDRKAWTIGADYSVIPHVLSIGAAYRNAKTGQAINAADVAVGRGVDNNAVTVTAVYDVTQNVALHLNYSQYSGNNTNTTAAGVTQAKNNMLLMLEAGF